LSFIFILSTCSLFIQAVTQDSCDLVSFKCINPGGSCNSDRFDLLANKVVVCNNSFASNDGSNCICQPYKNFGESCITNEECSNLEGFSMICTGKVCIWEGGAIAPGEACPSNANETYFSSPCASIGETCDNNCGMIVDTGEACNNSVTFCSPKDWCSTTSLSCEPRAQAGESCSLSGNSQSLSCDWDLICNGHQCIVPFSVNSGEACQSMLDCAAGLICSSGTCQVPTQNGLPCPTNEGPFGSCPDGYVCDCINNTSTDNTTGECVADISNADFTQNIQDLLSCMKKSDCALDFDWINRAAEPIFQHTEVTASYTADTCYVKACGDFFLRAIPALDVTNPCVQHAGPSSTKTHINN